MDDISGQRQGLPCHASMGSSFTLINGADSTQDQPAHEQSCYEILYIVSGSGYCSVNAHRRYVSSGDFLILRPDDRHSVFTNNTMRYYSIEFCLERDFSSHPLYSVVRKAIIGKSGGAVLLQKNSSLKYAFENVFSEWHRHDSLYLYYITLLFQQILIQCCRTLDSASLADDGVNISDDGVIDTFLVFISAYMEEPDIFGLFEKNYGYSRTYLSRIVKKKYNKTVFQLYTEKRFEYAAFLLTEGKTTISDIARRCAFAGVASFSKAFANFYHMSPTKYQSVSGNKTDPASAGSVYADFSTCSAAPDISANREPAANPAVYANPKFSIL